MVDSCFIHSSPTHLLVTCISIRFATATSALHLHSSVPSHLLPSISPSFSAHHTTFNPKSRTGERVCGVCEKRTREDDEKKKETHHLPPLYPNVFYTQKYIYNSFVSQLRRTCMERIRLQCVL